VRVQDRQHNGNRHLGPDIGPHSQRESPISLLSAGFFIARVPETG